MIVELLVLAVCLIFYLHYKKIKNLPPGPPSLPILGTVATLIDKKSLRSKDFYKYEDMYTMLLGPVTAIVINDFQRAKDLFFRDEFSGKRMSSCRYTWPVLSLPIHIW